MITRSILFAFLCFTGLNTFNIALAAPIIFDGVTDTVDTVVTNEITLRDGAVVNITDGGVQPPTEDPLPTFGAAAVTLRSDSSSEAPSTLNVSGGVTRGAGAETFPGDGRRRPDQARKTMA